MDDSTNSTNTVSSGLGTIANNTYDYINSLLSNPTLIIILVIVIIIYLIVFLSLGSQNDGESYRESNSDIVSNSSSTTITVIIFAFLFILIVINGVQYFFGIDIIAQLKNVFTGNPEVDITVNNPTPVTNTNSPIIPTLLSRPQVFNIPGNNYVYPDAKALCSAYDARLATYKEVEESYNEGGEWCNYGWSDGQMALYPTQQQTWDNLQKIEGHENDCGRPGVNGGYIANPAVKFGVNCYGIKPRINSTEEDLMANEPIYPKTLKDIAMENRVNYWKDKLSQILVSPFNHDSWSKL